tara:strand:+ start:4377 stop:5084 length:708 start_codon:yes stop_codon:yes gene_type:complete
MGDKKILNEEIKRFNTILEYSFFVDEMEKEGDSPEGNTEDLLLDVTEQEEEVTDVVEPTEEPVEEPTEEPTEEGGEDPFGGELPVEDEFADEPAMEEEPMGGEGEVEVDVSDIVDKTEEAKEEASQASSKIDDLLGKFSELEQKLTGMDAIINKMDELEKEVIERNPNPTEKLSMRSMDSFPYSVKLTDFWADREGYDATGEEGEEKEYTLTQQDIDDEYNESDIKGSFNPKTER